MFLVRVEIVKWVNDYQPGIVECKLVDASGEPHFFIEKVPIVSVEDLWSDTKYPRPGHIACEVIEQWTDETGKDLSRINTERPWAVESTQQRTCFVVLTSQLNSSS